MKASGLLTLLVTNFGFGLAAALSHPIAAQTASSEEAFKPFHSNVLSPHSGRLRGRSLRALKAFFKPYSFRVLSYCLLYENLFSLKRGVDHNQHAILRLTSTALRWSSVMASVRPSHPQK